MLWFIYKISDFAKNAFYILLLHTFLRKNSEGLRQNNILLRIQTALQEQYNDVVQYSFKLAYSQKNHI